MFNSRKCPIDQLANYIGGLQRNEFERTGRTDRAVTLDEIQSYFTCSYNTAAKSVAELKRRYGVQRFKERAKPKTTSWGKVISGRPEMAYYFDDGHRWEAAGQPLARLVVGQGGRSVAMDGWAGAMPMAEARAAIRSDRMAYDRREFNTYLSGRFDANGMEGYETGG